MHNVPMALVRECIRQGRKFDTLYAGPSASISAELMMGAGLVDRVVVGYIGYEHLGIAQVFRRLARSEASNMQIEEVDSGAWCWGFMQGHGASPSHLFRAHLRERACPQHLPGFYRWVTDPFTDERYIAVPAIRPSVALIHCQQADEYGNGIFKGSQFTDRLLGLASDTVLMQVEGIIDNNQVLKYPLQTGLPAFRASAVVPVNFGCHPTSSHRYYNYDDVHLRLYLRAAASEQGFAQYLQQYVMEPDSQEEYMRRVQNQDWSSISE